MATNAMITQRFTDMGFSEIRVSGSGSERTVEALWPLPDTEGDIPRQVSALIEI